MADKTLTGKYEGSIKDILYYDDKSNKETASDVTFTITVDGKQSDVNGDGVVDVADIATIIDMMSKGTGNTAADVNGDGVVDAALTSAAHHESSIDERLEQHGDGGADALGGERLH